MSSRGASLAAGDPFRTRVFPARSAFSTTTTTAATYVRARTKPAVFPCPDIPRYVIFRSDRTPVADAQRAVACLPSRFCLSLSLSLSLSLFDSVSFRCLVRVCPVACEKNLPPHHSYLTRLCLSRGIPLRGKRNRGNMGRGTSLYMNSTDDLQ